MELIARIRANFPAELVSEPRWCLWRYVSRDGKKTKPPFQPSGKPAESNNPATWSTFDAVSEALLTGKFEGIGCFISPPYVGIDFDHVCKNSDPLTIESWARAVIDSLDSYTEFSPSGAGLHVWCIGKLLDKGKRAGRVEIYASGRYFTVTGEVL